MLLVIDAGNSNVTLGVFQEEKLVAQWRLATDPLRTADEYGVQVRNLLDLEGIDYKAIRAIVIACVVPYLDFKLTWMAERYFQLTPLFVDHTTQTGLKILYDPPSDLGADRIVDAVAAVAKYGTPCIVVDFGTATTFNVINSAGEFLGGAISPGLMSCIDAFSRTAKLPTVEFERPNKAIASSTIGAMQSGLYYGYAGLVDGVIEQILEGMSGHPRIIATGGLAPLIATSSQYIDGEDENLTLDGLRLVYERNKREE